MSENAEQYKKFKNELNELIICPRCCKGVKAFIRKVITVDRFQGIEQTTEIHCAKCAIHGHKDGSFIEETFEGETPKVTDTRKGMSYLRR